MKRVVLALVLGWGASGAVAEPVSGDMAAAMLFDPSAQAIQFPAGVSEQKKPVLQTLLPLISQQMGVSTDYFGAIAYSPSEGLASRSLQGAFNFHSARAADRAALAACEAARPASSDRCSVVMRVLPRGYEARAVSLSRKATVGFWAVYSGKTGPKVLAISEATGAWGIGSTRAEAVAKCASSAVNARDCQAFVED